MPISIDYRCCNLCLSCVETYPNYFYYDEITNKVNVVEDSQISDISADDISSLCPRNCIVLEPADIKI